MLSLKEVAKEFSVTRQTVLNWVNNGTIKAVKVGGQYRVSHEEVQRLKDGK